MIDFLEKELEGLEALRTRFRDSRPHECCKCTPETWDCDGACDDGYCEVCKPLMEYVEDVLDPRIARLEELLLEKIKEDVCKTKNTKN